MFSFLTEFGLGRNRRFSRDPRSSFWIVFGAAKPIQRGGFAAKRRALAAGSCSAKLPDCWSNWSPRAGPGLSRCFPATFPWQRVILGRFRKQQSGDDALTVMTCGCLTRLRYTQQSSEGWTCTAKNLTFELKLKEGPVIRFHNISRFESSCDSYFSQDTCYSFPQVSFLPYDERELELGNNTWRMFQPTVTEAAHWLFLSANVIARFIKTCSLMSEQLFPLICSTSFAVFSVLLILCDATTSLICPVTSQTVFR